MKNPKLEIRNSKQTRISKFKLFKHLNLKFVSNFDIRASKPAFTNGFAIVEIIVAAAIISVGLFGLLGAAQYYARLSRETVKNVQAQFLVEEGLEALRSMRDNNYVTKIQALGAGTTYYLYWNGSAWTSTTTLQTADGFTRSFTVAHANRDVNDDIVTSGGTDDSNTRNITMTVSWTSTTGSTTSKTMSTYFTNYFR